MEDEAADAARDGLPKDDAFRYEDGMDVLKISGAATVSGQPVEREKPQLGLGSARVVRLNSYTLTGPNEPLQKGSGAQRQPTQSVDTSTRVRFR